MSPVRAGMRIPSNVKAWFVYLKDKIRPDPDKTTHMIMNTFIKANDINSEQLIKFSGSLKTIMTCIFEQIETENPGDVDKLHSFFTSYYTGIDKKFDSRLESVKDGLKEHALSLFEKTQPSTQPSKKGRIGVGGGGDGSKRKRNRNIKVTIKHKRINKKQSIKNKNFTRK
jgi:hypothetical protein